jgi:hypothetical protein
MGIEKGVGFPITAIDQFSGAFDKLKGKVTEAQGGFDKLKGVMTGAIAGVSVAGFAMIVQHAIDAADAMGKLQQKTGIAVTELSKLAYGAELSDVSMEQFGKGLKAFAGKMVEASDATSKAGKLFRVLGVDVTNGPKKALEQLADSVSKMRDGEVKTTLATELFSRAGMDMIPWLNEGATGMRKAGEEAERLGIVISEKAAKSAQEFNDNTKALKKSTEALGMAFVNSYGQGLSDASGAMKEALIQGGKLSSLWVGLGAVGAFLFTDSMLSDAEKYRKKIEEVTEQMKFYNKEAEIAAGKGAPNKAFLEAAGRLQGLIRAMRLAEEAAAGAFNDQVSRAATPRARGAAAGGKGPDEAAIRALLAAQNDAKKAGEELVATLDKELARISNLTGEDRKLNEITLELAKSKYDKLAPAVRDEIMQLAIKIDKKKEELRIDRMLNEEHEKDLAFVKDRGQALADLANKWADQTEELENEIELLGKGNLAREKAILLRQRENAIAEAFDDAATIRDINAEYEKQIGLLERRNEIQEQLSVGNELAERGARIFVDALQKIHSLRDELKQFGLELAELFAKRFILQIAASITGSSALSSAAGAVGQNTLGGAVMNSIGSWFGNSAMGGALSGAWGNFQAGYIAQSAFMSGAAETAPQFGTYMGQFGGAIAKIMPVLGYFAIAIAGAAVAAHQYAAGWRLSDQNNTSTSLGGIFSGGESGIPGATWMASAMDRSYRALGFNDQWAAILSGSSMAQRIFGHRARQGDAMGVRGTIGSGGVTGENWQDWSEQGGWFTSTNRGTNTANFGDSQQRYFASMMAPIGTIVSHLAERFGVDPNAALSGYSRSFNLQLNENGEPKSDEEIAAMFNELFIGVLQDQVERVLRTGGNTKLADYVKGLKGSADEVGSTIHNVLALMDSIDSLGQTIAVLEGGPIEALKQSLKGVDDRVTDAKQAFTEALAGGDPGEINAKQRELMQAVMDRYNAEITMVRQLQSAVRQIEQEAYQFALDIAGRINSVGGSRDIGAIAMARATQLRGGIGGSTPVQFQIQDLQQYIGAIDTWYNSQRSAIEQQMAAEIAQQQAIFQAQAQAAQARVNALEKELEVAEQFQGIVDRTTQMLKDMQLSSANPLAISGRLSMAKSEVDRLRDVYEHAKGSAKSTAANDLLNALQRYQALGMEAYQRPSPEWQKIYNEIVSEITAVQGDAKTQADKIEGIQEKIRDYAAEAAMWGSMTATASTESSAKLEALNKEALTYYTWAEQQGTALYAMQRQSYMDQLNAITGGMEVDLFIADRQKEAVDELKQIRELIQAWLNNPTGTNVPGGGGATPGGGSTGGGTGGSGSNTNQPLTVNVTAGAGVSTAQIVDAVKAAAPAIKRALKHA